MIQSTPSLLDPRPSGLLPFLLGSIVGHGAIVSLALVLSWLLAGPRVNLDTKPIKASLVRLGKPRDEKLLPRKEEEAAPPPETVTAPPSPAPVPPPSAAVKIPSKEVKPDPTPTPPKDASKESLFAALGKAGRAGKAEELEGAADGDPSGDSAQQEGERYFGLLKSVVHRHYEVDDTIPESERRQLKAEVALRIGHSGELIEVRLLKASGNELFDTAVLAAIKKTAPFTPPPEHLKQALKQDGVAFVFRAVD